MPFESEKQRRFLWANKPEVARKFAEHAAEGKKIGGRRVTKGQKVGQSNLVPVLDELANFVPGIGDVKAFAEAETPLDYGLAGIGLFPGFGDLAAGGMKLGASALLGKHAVDPNYAKHLKDKWDSFNPGWDPKDPKTMEAIQQLGADAAYMRANPDVPHVGNVKPRQSGVFQKGLRGDVGYVDEVEVDPTQWANTFDIPPMEGVPAIQLMEDVNQPYGFRPFSAVPENDIFKEASTGKFRGGKKKFKSLDTEETVENALQKEAIKRRGPLMAESMSKSGVGSDEVMAAAKAAKEAGMSSKEVAAKFGISASQAKKL